MPASAHPLPPVPAHSPPIPTLQEGKLSLREGGTHAGTHSGEAGI